MREGLVTAGRLYRGVLPRGISSCRPHRFREMAAVPSGQSCCGTPLRQPWRGERGKHSKNVCVEAFRHLAMSMSMNPSRLPSPHTTRGPVTSRPSHLCRRQSHSLVLARRFASRAAFIPWTAAARVSGALLARCDRQQRWASGSAMNPQWQWAGQGIKKLMGGSELDIH
jgi:hypothetical protein